MSPTCSDHASAGIDVELVPMSTEGDRRTDVPLSVIGGKGVFAKEVQAAVHRRPCRPRRPLGQGPPGAHARRAGDRRRARAGRSAGCAGRDAGWSTCPTDGGDRDRFGPAPGAARPPPPGPRSSPSCGATWPPGWRRPTSSPPSSWPPSRWSGSAWPTASPRCSRPRCSSPRSARVRWRSSAGPTTARHARCWAGIEHAPSRRTLDAERAFLTELGGDCSLPAGAHAEVVAGGGAAPMRAILGRGSERGPASCDTRRPVTTASNWAAPLPGRDPSGRCESVGPSIGRPRRDPS